MHTFLFLFLYLWESSLSSFAALICSAHDNCCFVPGLFDAGRFPLHHCWDSLAEWGLCSLLGQPQHPLKHSRCLNSHSKVGLEPPLALSVPKIQWVPLRKWQLKLNIIDRVQGFAPGWFSESCWRTEEALSFLTALPHSYFTPAMSQPFCTDGHTENCEAGPCLQQKTEICSLGSFSVHVKQKEKPIFAFLQNLNHVWDRGRWTPQWRNEGWVPP